MKRLKIIAIFLIFLLIIVLLFYLVKNTKVSDISCRSQYGECSVLIKEKLNEISNCDYFSCKKNIDTLLSDVWIINEYTYQLKLPLKIEVYLVEKKPKYSLKSEAENLVVQVDTEGLVLDERQTSNLPGVYINEKLPSPGQNVSEKQYFALEIVYGVSKITSFGKTYLQEDTLSVYLIDGKKVLFPSQGDRDFLLGSLALILNELKKDGSDFKISKGQIETIDLRYKNPVLIPHK